MAVEVLPRIVIDPSVRAGKPVIAGTRIPVEDVLDLLWQGLTPEQVVSDCFPSLTTHDVAACLRYAAQVVRDEEVHVQVPRPA